MVRLTKLSQPATQLKDHLRELAIRLAISLAAMTITGFVVYAFYEPILTLLRSPLNAPLYYSNPAGSFAFILKICFMGSLIVTIPVIVYNLIMFIRPAFEEKIKKKNIYIASASSAVLSIAGAIFAFNIILPGSLTFFAGFQVNGLNALISADSYLNFITSMIITFVIIFQLPLAITFIDTIKPLPPERLIKNEKWVILGSLVVALLAPFTYDFVTSLLIALPIIVLYNLSIAVVAIRHAKHKPANEIIFVEEKTPNLSVTFDMIIEELAQEKKDFPVYNNAATLKIPNNKHCMDIKPKNAKVEPINTLIWMEKRKAKQNEINAKTRVFSDIIKIPRANHALTLQ
ncbi:MAG: twin-arginine translocase subunit TatC [Candidatus Saccharibacteria bacterium]